MVLTHSLSSSPSAYYIDKSLLIVRGLKRRPYFIENATPTSEETVDV